MQQSTTACRLYGPAALQAQHPSHIAQGQGGRSMSAPLAIAVERSNNSKIGAMSATYATQRTCPKECPLRDEGCYAETGPMGFTTKRLNRAANGSRYHKAVAYKAAKQEAQAIDALSGAYPLRLHV